MGQKKGYSDFKNANTIVPIKCQIWHEILYYSLLVNIQCSSGEGNSIICYEFHSNCNYSNLGCHSRKHFLADQNLPCMTKQAFTPNLTKFEM